MRSCVSSSNNVSSASEQRRRRARDAREESRVHFGADADRKRRMRRLIERVRKRAGVDPVREIFSVREDDQGPVRDRVDIARVGLGRAIEHA